MDSTRTPNTRDEGSSGLTGSPRSVGPPFGLPPSTGLSTDTSGLAQACSSDKDSCPDCGGKLWHQAGCAWCPSCGYSDCSNTPLQQERRGDGHG
jgi:hypothetical protein